MSFATRVNRLKREFGHPALGAAAIFASNFLNGGEAGFARACSAKGDMIEIVRRGEE